MQVCSYFRLLRQQLFALLNYLFYVYIYNANADYLMRTENDSMRRQPDER